MWDGAKVCVCVCVCVCVLVHACLCMCVLYWVQGGGGEGGGYELKYRQINKGLEKTVRKITRSAPDDYANQVSKNIIGY